MNWKRLNRKARKICRNLSKNYQMFHTSLNLQTKVFFEHSTLHGVRYIAEDDRPFIEKFIWFACVAIGAVATIVIIVSLWEKFQTNPTITGLDTDFHNWDVPFPAITICPYIPSNLTVIRNYVEKNLPNYLDTNIELLLLKLTQLSYNTLADFVKYSEEITLPDDTNIKDLVFGLMNKCEDIFVKCKFRAVNFDCCNDFFPVFTESGFCYTFNSRYYERKIPWQSNELPAFTMRYIKETDIEWALQFTVNDNETNMPIYILNSDESVGIDVQPQHIWDYKVDKMYFSVKQTYTTDDTRQLSIKQRHCVFSDEIHLKIDYIYTYTACTRQCRMDMAMLKCHCVPHFYPELPGEFYRHCKINELACINTHLNEIKSSIDQCACELGCSNTVYEIEKLTEASEDEVQQMTTEFVSWPMVRYKREVLFGWVDLLVSFGGIAGLFLGFSLLSGVEIIYYFTIRACCMLVRDRNELEQIQYEKMSKSHIDYDLSLVPYFLSQPYPGNGLNEVAKYYYYQQNIFNTNNKIAPIIRRTNNNNNKRSNNGNWISKETILPPFGIEFIN